MKFDGKDLNLEASTWVELTLYHKDATAVPIASWKQRLISIIGRNGDFEWIPLKLKDGQKAPMVDVPIEVHASFSIKNTASVLGLGTQNVLPVGCGATYGVRKLIESNEARLRRVELKVKRAERLSASLAQKAKQNEFD